MPGIDPLTPVHRVTTGSEMARAVGPALQTRQWILASAYLLGIAEAVERQSSSYAVARKQFGQPIGAFQAVKHRCADMFTRCYVAGAQLRLATLFVEGGRTDARFQSASALTLALTAARENTSVNIQNHGGIGYTHEHDAGLYLKRVVPMAAALGNPAQWLEAVLQQERTVFV
jgi:alkylation response protein AidB-like acyl-CoA dehydrogenase